MRTVLLVSAVLGLGLAAQPAQAQRHDTESDVRVVERQPLRRASSAIHTRGGEVALLLVDRRLVMQLTDAGLDEIERDMANDAKKEESGFARFVSGVVRSGVRTLLDRGIEYPVSELREARYERGRLVLVDREGNELFRDVQVNDIQVMESFSPAEARAFAARVNQARRRADL
ncbi:MAG: hypothetical protein AVDCRST_MAG68-2315 [uncultured Gemmatimonadetes bacterium]|uniref:Uncharacterized protein n=1 Tax=uncultured Gemmatimonadota bacterium TaxID=203437 RepID=A0A6J4LA80_9BACT|nr:MAG: hypothetical protein AVDCRST_MAG68-2315 [uncultured Gemmatimonadota bacterium]